MDLLAHALYGSTVCSRTGFAGGLRGSPHRWYRDPTVWLAAFFGVLPDLVSMGPSFLSYWLGGMQGHYFRDVDGSTLVRYRYMHSVIVALAFSGVLRVVWRTAWIPSLAWALHVLMDAATHSTGKFQTTLLYPFSTWGVDGIRWWMHPELILAYWLALPASWYALSLWRRHAQAQQPSPPNHPKSDRVPARRSQ